MSFAWSAPDACPSAPDVQARIEQRLGAALELGDHELAVTVTQEGDAFVARIAFDGGDSRTLTAGSCNDLADAVAVIAARLATERRAEVVVHAPPPPPAPAPAPTPVPPPPSREPWRFAARVAGASALGILPGVGFGAELAAVGERGPASAELAFVQWASSAQPATGFMVDHVDVGLRAAALRVGYRVGPLPLRATAGAELGSMTGRGARSGSGTWLAFGAGIAGFYQATPRLRVVAAAEVDVARDRVRFTLSDGTLEYEPDVTSARATLGLEVEFP